MNRTLLDWLAAKFPTAKRQTLKRMVQSGRVTIDGRPARKLGEPLRQGADVKVVDQPTPDHPPAPEAPFRVVYEDTDLLIVDKPPGLLTSTVPREPRPTLWAMVKDFVARKDRRARAGLIHRLDRDASGLLVFSKNDAAYRSLKTQFFEHTVDRVYTTLVQGAPTPPAGRVESFLVERADGTVHATRQIGKGQHAVTHYEVLQRREGLSLLRVTLHTGRKHQIRVHLSGRGTPIVGDTVYGRGDDHAGRLMLAATRLAFTHPRTGERLTFELPAPPVFTRE